jgi:hypothetical protein
MQEILIFIIGAACCYFIMKKLQKNKTSKEQIKLEDIAYNNRAIFWKYCKVQPNNRFSSHISGYASTRDISLSAVENLAKHIEILNKLIDSKKLFEFGIVEQDDRTRNDIMYRGPQIYGDQKKYITTYAKGVGEYNSIKVELNDAEVAEMEAVEKLCRVVNAMTTSQPLAADKQYITDAQIELANSYIAKLK